MTNLGFRLAMAEPGINVVETPVGDRYVLEALEEGAWSLGGEQSGHVIFRDLATTGDGLLTGLQLLDVVARTGRPLADLAAECHDPAAAGAGQRAAVDRLGPGGGRAHHRRGGGGRTPSSARGAGCWCGPAAPSRWCG